MISVLIKILTVVFVLISIGTIEKKKSIIKKIFKSINESYHELVNQQGSIMGFLLKSCGILLLVSFYLISFEKCDYYFTDYVFGIWKFISNIL